MVLDMKRGCWGSVDPHNGKEFDALYAHFPNGGIVVKEVKKFQQELVLVQLGGMKQKDNHSQEFGSMTGPHTSLDFFEPNTKKGQISGPYSNAAALTNYIIGNANRAVSHMSTVTRPIKTLLQVEKKVVKVDLELSLRMILNVVYMRN